MDSEKINQNNLENINNKKEIDIEKKINNKKIIDLENIDNKNVIYSENVNTKKDINQEKINNKKEIDSEKNNNKNNIDSENLINRNIISTDLEIKHSKTNFIKNNMLKNNMLNSLQHVPEEKNDSQKMSVENIVKLVGDVSQSINKILLDGSQSQFQRRSSIREVSRSFILNTNNKEIKEFLNKSTDNGIIENENENEDLKIKNYKDFQNSSSNLNKNLNLKCKINYNVLSNDIISKNSSRKLKIKNDISNIKNLTSTANNKKNSIKDKEREIQNYNSYKNSNKKTIKKIMPKPDKYKNKEKDKNLNKNKENELFVKEKEKKNLVKEENKKAKDKENKNSFINIIQDNPTILSTILQFLSFKNKICFLSISKFLSKERINLIINKRGELMIILQLKENETIDDKINNFKKVYNKKEPPLKEFKLSKENLKNLQKLNDPQNTKLLKENIINNNKITEINIIYRILLLLFGEKQIVEISDDNLFWENCCKYLNNKSIEGKIGNFIISKVDHLCFDHQTINSIESIIIGNKNNILNGYYEKLCKTTGLIIPLIKESLEYCGIIIPDLNNISGKILDNLQYNKKMITKLDSIINNYSEK